MTQYPKRLIEVDLPIRRISAHARREKSIRHGHISTLHIWWARRRLAACRAVICAALWLDPADPLCSPAFREAAATLILGFARKVTTDTKLANEHCSPENFKLWSRLVAEDEKAKGLRLNAEADQSDTSGFRLQPLALRHALLDFIADFANWDNSTVREYLDTSRAITAVAHNALSNPNFKLPAEGADFSIANLKSQIANLPRPLVLDPFCGGGSIPLEALRVGADAFASDLNPVSVLINKLILEYIPKYGRCLADEVRKWGEWIKREAKKELAKFDPKNPDGAAPIAYLWARTIQCEGPNCGAEVPLIRSLWLAKKANRSIALQLVPRRRARRVDFQIIVNQRGGWVNQDDPKIKIEDPKFEGTVKRGSATCPCCGCTTPVSHVRAQLTTKRGGANSARLLSVVTRQPNQQGRFFRLATHADEIAIRAAGHELEKRKNQHRGQLSLVPDENNDESSMFNNSVPIYGMVTWGDMFSNRQLLAITTLVHCVQEARRRINIDDSSLATAIATSLAFCVDKVADLGNSYCRWEPVAQCPRQLFARQAIPMVWDPAESVPTGDSSGSFGIMVERYVHVLEQLGSNWGIGQCERASATHHPLLDDCALGPALEIFSRYSRVEKANGDNVTLKEFLEQVWAAVAKEALSMILAGADATGFEEDARLTAMWLWTLKTGHANDADVESTDDDSDEEESGIKKGGGSGFVLEFDAARKIAQGLGAHLEDMASLVAVEGETARLLPVAERARALFGKDEGKAVPVRRKRDPQMDLFKVLKADDEGQASFGETKIESVGNTVLDRVHQSMILFAAGRSEALKRFLVDDGAGNDQRFWRLAQALSALYPTSTDEKRWVDGVLARKKGLGF
jgi:hypothetical protein